MNNTLTREELKKLRLNQPNVIVLDVRSEEEYNNGHIPFASNFPVELIENGEIFEAKPGSIIVTTCGRGGGRANRAANILRQNPQNQVFTLEGGSLGWLDNEKE
ncbi:MAG: rhodanese-like domain-containing protein [Bacteroidia bacterium]|nr:rhodanese-like domain-containing protein [Bacteroidia bacterium]